MKAPLFLTRHESNQPISVPASVVEYLHSYQINGIRFLYQQCFLKNHNVILNNDVGMNESRQISSFLVAVPKSFPTLIVCQHKNIPKWYYEFSIVDLNVATAEEFIKETSDTVKKIPDVILVSHDQLKHIKVLSVEKWFFFVVEDIDLLIKSRYIKNVNSQFRICITTHNYLIDCNPELQWSILKWANPNLVEDKESFIKTDKTYEENLLNPFPEYWRRITWLTTGKPMPTESEIKDYDDTIRDWSITNKLKFPIENTKVKGNKRANKRQSNEKQENKKSKTVNKRRQPNKTIIKSKSSNDSNLFDNKPKYCANLEKSNDEIGNNNTSFTSKTKEKPAPQTKNDIKENKRITQAKKIDSDYEIEDENSNDTFADNSEMKEKIDNIKANKKDETSDDECKIESEQEVQKENEDKFNSNGMDDEEDQNNSILDSLVENSQPFTRNYDEIQHFPEEDSCPILDLLF